jgi:formylglycine-generating enzyme
LYLPDGGDMAPPRAAGQEILPGPWGTRSTRCSNDMVDVRGQFCIDRFESMLVDTKSRRTISPYYHPTRSATKAQYSHWQRVQPNRPMSVPVPPAWQLEEEFEPRAVAEKGVVPNGYISAEVAERACTASGKRLCTQSEWVTACRGEENRKYPYGDKYVQGTCNVFREGHPAMELYGNPSINHLDPRLNLVDVHGKKLLRPTGTTPACASRWGADAVYDMVGNLDEWVDDAKGMFLGGFFSRGTREGCDSSITAHPRPYYDYSLGVRCCK